MECLKPATISEASVKEIRELEHRHGVTLIAYEKFRPYKKLKTAELEKLKTAEKESGAILVAYEA